MKNNKTILVVFSLVLVLLGIIITVYPKGELELIINQNYNPNLGIFFKYATHLGDGFLYALVILIFLCLNYFNAILLSAIALIQTIIIQLLKKIVFAEVLRPKAFFENQSNIILNFTEGVQVHTSHSFPSGHTATAFAVAFFLAYTINKKYALFLFVGLAVTAGFSRIYLMQHFFIDVFAGALIGTATSFITIQLFNRYLPKLKANQKLQKGLLKR